MFFPFRSKFTKSANANDGIAHNNKKNFFILIRIYWLVNEWYIKHKKSVNFRLASSDILRS